MFEFILFKKYRNYNKQQLLYTVKCTSDFHTCDCNGTNGNIKHVSFNLMTCLLQVFIFFPSNDSLLYFPFGKQVLP